MICPRCGAYNPNTAYQCVACAALFEGRAKREGMALEDATGLANDLRGRWIFAGISLFAVGILFGLVPLLEGKVLLAAPFVLLAIVGFAAMMYGLSGT